ncbi:hypothetical protein C8Q77DRAFT_1072717 [Trametes polyzona]|nr:hypothetical protein C8Q77DRAFT_1072717 [Trametes polyzona]
MAQTVTIWDSATIIKHEEEDAIIPPDNHFVLYTIAEEPESSTRNISGRGVPSRPTRGNVPIPTPAPGNTLRYPPPIMAATRFRLPLPRGNDPNFRHEVRVNGKLGLQLSTCCAAGEDIIPLRVLGIVMRTVEGAGNLMEHLCFGPNIWIERAYFPTESETRVRDQRRAVVKRDYAGGVTQGLMLALMIEKQYKHWCELSLWDEVELEPLLGNGAIWAKGSRVGWDALFIVAIRRHKSRSPDGNIRWFPELEIRVTC